jgi:hypothetical protein
MQDLQFFSGKFWSGKVKRRLCIESFCCVSDFFFFLRFDFKLHQTLLSVKIFFIGRIILNILEGIKTGFQPPAGVRICPLATVSGHARRSTPISAVSHTSSCPGPTSQEQT